MPQHRNEMERMDSIILREYGSHSGLNPIGQAMVQAAQDSLTKEARQAAIRADELTDLVADLMPSNVVELHGWSRKV